MRKNLLILGATSEIGMEVNKLFAQEGSNFILVGRSEESIKTHKEDLKRRGANKVISYFLDFAEENDEEKLINIFEEKLEGRIDIVFLNYAVLGRQEEEEVNLTFAMKNFYINFISAFKWAFAAGNYFKDKDGRFIYLNSVAAERGRRGNFFYGASKSGMKTIMEGFANKFAYSNTFFINIKLGIIKTRMSSEVKGISSFLAYDPIKTARKIFLITKLNKPRSSYYLPYFWKYIILIIKLLPEKILFNIN